MGGGGGGGEERERFQSCTRVAVRYEKARARASQQDSAKKKHCDPPVREGTLVVTDVNRYNTSKLSTHVEVVRHECTSGGMSRLLGKPE